MRDRVPFPRLTWWHLFGAPDARLWPSAGLGAMVLTGVEQRIADVTDIEPGDPSKFVGGLEKPGYTGVDLDGTAVRLNAVYLF